MILPAVDDIWKRYSDGKLFDVFAVEIISRKIRVVMYEHMKFDFKRYEYSPEEVNEQFTLDYSRDLLHLSLKGENK